MTKITIRNIVVIFILCCIAVPVAAKPKKQSSSKSDSSTSAVKQTQPSSQSPSSTNTSGGGVDGTSSSVTPAVVPPVPMSSRYADNGDGTILDKNSKLVWVKDADVNNLPMPYEGAKSYIQDMNSGKRPNFGYSDWRLPTINEIETLLDKAKYYPALPVGNPFVNVQNSFYWSSSTGKDVVDYVWIVDLASGEMTMDYVSACSYKFFWPVRSSFMSTSTRASGVMTGGTNEFGQLGDGSASDRDLLLPLSGMENVVRVSAGQDHAIALKSDGSVWAWGRNNRGQLGNGTLEDSRVPVAAKEIRNIVDIAAGQLHSLALASDGTVWAWGRNSYGQIGNGINEDTTMPVQISGLADVVKIAAGMFHSLAVKRDGTVWAWGRNVYGQLGVGSTVDSNKPVQIVGLNNVTAIGAGMHHSVAVTADKTVWAWGLNYHGMLGDGSKSDQLKPVRVTSMNTSASKGVGDDRMGEAKPLDDVIDIKVGLHHTLALKSDGSVWSWGGNEFNQLGNKSSLGMYAEKINGLSQITKISAGMYHSVAVMQDGSLWVWGKDIKNQSYKQNPVRLWDVAGINDVAAGRFYTIVLSGGKSAQ